MTEAELIQGSPEWRAARCGSLGASQIAEALARTRTGWGAGRANVAAAMVAERLTGEPQEAYANAAMAWGTEKEPEAREAYAFQIGADVSVVGLVRHPSISRSHASPDGLVGNDGLVEIKCPNTATHIETLTVQRVAGKYATQIQWQLACTGRQWCDFVSYDPRMPTDMSLYVQRITRDDAAIAELERDVREFLAEVDAKVAQLEALYRREAA